METSGFACPVCRVRLLHVETDTGSLPVCSGCGGTWLDNVRSHRVVKGLISERERQAAVDVSAQASRADVGPPVAAGPRPCPECSTPMARTKVAQIGIELDACAAHGTWFDARELEAVARMFAGKAGAEAGSGPGLGARMLTRWLR